MQIEYDDKLNEAGWQMIHFLENRGQLSGDQFNNMKSFLKEIIESYLEKMTADEGMKIMCEAIYKEQRKKMNEGS